MADGPTANFATLQDFGASSPIERARAFSCAVRGRGLRDGSLRGGVPLTVEFRILRTCRRKAWQGRRRRRVEDSRTPYTRSRAGIYDVRLTVTSGARPSPELAYVVAGGNPPRFTPGTGPPRPHPGIVDSWGQVCIASGIRKEARSDRRAEPRITSTSRPKSGSFAACAVEIERAIADDAARLQALIGEERGPGPAVPQRPRSILMRDSECRRRGSNELFSPGSGERWLEEPRRRLNWLPSRSNTGEEDSVARKTDRQA